MTYYFSLKRLELNYLTLGKKKTLQKYNFEILKLCNISYFGIIKKEFLKIINKSLLNNIIAINVKKIRILIYFINSVKASNSRIL